MTADISGRSFRPQPKNNIPTVPAELEIRDQECDNVT